jgi:hypothetical protein
VVGSYEHGNEPLIPQKMGNFSTSWAAISFSWRTMLHSIELFMIWVDLWS